ncbi:M48 family metalloprotease [Halorubrum sp. AD140]|uniref:M48 family metalloprotease n=1 Tax=Halorubrum sp. AD140 TaxID=3050073 RepID=UPI002ACCD804|nr:M48 family metalloprotease [Halorubrum sp. AD140]MDZ5811636.1 M48 family metalloprotease [Halorubrum sp. AD140]
MPSKSLALTVKMVSAVIGLSVVAVGFLVGVWTVPYGILSFFDVASASYLAAGITSLTIVTVGYLEYRQIDAIERVADAQRVDREAEPALYELVTRIATQLDIPIPTIALSERQAPEALAVGFRPGNIHLILSRGTLDTLDGTAELEAVIAHELAHVKNRDAMVMTIVSLPVILANGLGSRLADVENPGWAAIVIVPLAFISTIFWVIGKAITARLSRVRERAADHVAAEITGSPAALATALKQLDQDISETPNRDLREVSGISSLSILPLEPEELEKVMLGPEGNTEPSYWWLRTRLHQLERWLFRTHPPTDNRIEQLAAYERTHERRSEQNIQS